jgi:hypothetical protein
MYVLCTHIKWDTVDDEGEIIHPAPRMPTTMVVETENGLTEEAIEDCVSDAMSDATGFCLTSFCWRQLKKPVFAIVKGKQYWDGKEWVNDRHFAKVYVQLGAVRNAYPKVGGTCAVSLTDGQLVY